MGRIKDFFKYSKEDSLIRDSAVLFIATSGLSLAGFLFHFFLSGNGESGRVLAI